MNAEEKTLEEMMRLDADRKEAFLWKTLEENLPKWQYKLLRRFPRRTSQLLKIQVIQKKEYPDMRQAFGMASQPFGVRIGKNPTIWMPGCTQ